MDSNYLLNSPDCSHFSLYKSGRRRRNLALQEELAINPRCAYDACICVSHQHQMEDVMSPEDDVEDCQPFYEEHAIYG